MDEGCRALSAHVLWTVMMVGVLGPQTKRYKALTVHVMSALSLVSGQQSRDRRNKLISRTEMTQHRGITAALLVFADALFGLRSGLKFGLAQV